jgi:hypothetical protein
MTPSRPSCRAGGTASASTPGAEAGPTTPTTTYHISERQQRRWRSLLARIATQIDQVVEEGLDISEAEGQRRIATLKLEIAVAEKSARARTRHEERSTGKPLSLEDLKAEFQRNGGGDR